ncbi:MAG TPA: response regulator [Candidatus Kapabacteria bacterium]|nr:response regulator [Candidatus Kapabacteria bacterium]
MRKASILVVDDNKITTKLLRRYLEANGYEAREAYDGIDCLEKVEEQQPDAIVLDVMMPRMDGYETVEKLKEQEHTRHIPVVIVTALNDVANQLKSIDSGADDFLSKPIEERLLIAKVKLLSTFNIHSLNSKFCRQLIDDLANGSISPQDAKQKADEYLQ